MTTSKDGEERDSRIFRTANSRSEFAQIKNLVVRYVVEKQNPKRIPQQPTIDQAQYVVRLQMKHGRVEQLRTVLASPNSKYEMWSDWDIEYHIVCPVFKLPHIKIFRDMIHSLTINSSYEKLGDG